MLTIASVSGDPPQTPLGELTMLPKPPSREWLFAFGNRSFAPSALNLPLAPPNKNTRPVSPPKHKILEPPLPCPPHSFPCPSLHPLTLSPSFFVLIFSPLFPSPLYHFAPSFSFSIFPPVSAY